MNIEWGSGTDPALLEGDALCFIISEAQIQGEGIPAEWAGRLSRLSGAGLFSGKPGQIYILPVLDRPELPVIILAGSGDGRLGMQELRLLMAQTVRAAARLKAALLIVAVPDELHRQSALTAESAGQAIAEGLVLGAYRRRHYKLEQPAYSGPGRVRLHMQRQSEALEDASWKLGIARGLALGEATNLARELTNLPGNMLTPSGLAAAAVAVAERHGLPAEVLDEQELALKGMGGLLAVGQGSNHPPRMIAIRYQGGSEWKDVVGLVGKGITFDTGGISLKRAPGMEDMISDMGGAAAVLGVIEALGRLRPPVNVIMLIPAAENMPAANAFKPGDIITSLSGRTIEVLNTDAEGRIVLGDAITYAREWGAERIIDVATLTGAVVSILGDIATGAVTNNRAFLEEILEAAGCAGEQIWELPAYPEFRELLKSDVADLRNAAGRYGGATTAGLFIGEFAEGLPWVHLDIAGTAFLPKERGVNPKGATGVMVRTLLEYLLRSAARPGIKAEQPLL
ncbi:leucyl aminopeptidase [Paenibacillus sp. MMS20-IR301]|uniref:leucyl aminopeptidase n=1 Tax=Paenibacillus sp. MMS20-IR301 TaxID=2895946 RepID=UPI0028E1B75A|nr:leucyl aminopeptidase [Paenibacillus sp. MMS20-IR301]WNS40905.1 leucyl aminopeptidase [Paenibacillus sp. MMS20-IR301]